PDAAPHHSVAVHGETVVADVDPAQVERIIENLVSNAARHTPEGTPIAVRVEAVDGGALVVVDDEGPGIPEPQRESIFEAFEQVAGRRPYDPGVGVGLSLVARFAELHGGRAWVEPRAGGGSSFRVFLPGAADGSPGTS
ncbi:MAG: sensor histidine kinase, partial [Nocardioidaceae bacterium]